MTEQVKGTVLVTGGAGYIGSHACKALSRGGYMPIAYDSLIYGHDWAVKWGPLERGDILDRARLDEVILKHRPSAIMHFAAFAYVGESVSDPGKYYRNNVGGSLNLLEAARDHGIDKFLFSSTCATYGVPGRLPITEDTPQQPINPYGASKVMVERMIDDFGAAHGLRSMVLRYFNAAGADPDGEIGEDHEPETHLVPLILDAASGKRPDITVFGYDYDTPDGTCIRDYIHVADLSNAHVKALDALVGGRHSGVFNLGNGRGFSVHEVIAAAKAVTGCAIDVKTGERRAGDPACLVASADRARDELDWMPAHSSLETIVGHAWSWHQRHKSLARQF